MSEPDPLPGAIRLGVFELDLEAGELRKSDVRIKLQEQPLQVLALLLEHPGQIVTREAHRASAASTRARIWSDVTPSPRPRSFL
jgi:DNA-binding response OmpR family regulator